MGMIMSFSEALENIWFTRLKKGAVHKAECVIILDRPTKDGPDLALVKLASGRWTVLGSRHTPNGNWAVMGYGLNRLDQSVLKALVSAGAVTREICDEHLRRVSLSSEKQRQDRAWNSLKEACDVLGIEPPVPSTDIDGGHYGDQ